ncbi:sensor histidine kinase [Nostocoides sp.]|uniref:sensor histidine kinase n=2 Tax=Nostocoides sp. TaxID=1917966 RepID=UPI002C3185CD|nr:histidine kinase [Tetrasphaera sp.]
MPIPRDPPTPPLDRLGKAWRVAFVLGIGVVAWVSVMSALPEDAGSAWSLWLTVGDPVLGVIAMILASWRRRWPLAIGAIVAIIGAVSLTAAGAVLLVLASVATRRHWRELAWLIPLNIAAGVVSEWLAPATPDASPSWYGTLAMMVLITAAVSAIGYAVGGRRELERQRLEAAQLDAARRAAQAAAAERTRIAREMHDVLAHRISLVAMHAGALNYRTDLAPHEMRTALTTIETNAHQALADLREVLGVLRSPSGAETDDPERPQPDLGDLPGLIGEAESLGTRVRFVDESVGAAPAGLGRTAYRVVQEALTNARKHAPGTVVQVRVTGSPPEGLRIEIRNPRPVQTSDRGLPHSGLGLLGLQERVTLAGGHLNHGPQPDGGYAVSAWLPWPGLEPAAGVTEPVPPAARPELTEVS